jgi:hypothetical protein
MGIGGSKMEMGCMAAAMVSGRNRRKFGLIIEEAIRV